jgi:hypothetical protein
MNPTLEKLNTDISHLQKEIKFLRSFIIGMIVKDKEGEYKAEFVKKITRASQTETCRCFKDKKTFLAQLENI